MKKSMVSVKGVMVGVTGLVASMMAAGAANATDLTIDYAAIATSVTAQLTQVMPVVLGITGTILAIGVGIKLFKRFAK